LSYYSDEVRTNVIRALARGILTSQVIEIFKLQNAEIYLYVDPVIHTVIVEDLQQQMTETTTIPEIDEANEEEVLMPLT
jgi:hypothetical protein